MKSRRVQFGGLLVAASPNDTASGDSKGMKGYPRIPTHGEIKVGYAPRLVIALAERLGIPPASMAERIGVSRSTFHRKLRGHALLTEHESDSLARHSSLLSQAIAVFDGDEEAAKQWLSCPQVGLGNGVPLDLAQTSFGYREVEKLLTRIDHGAYA
jgi:putative toxin-antitoxin system antitoxin component (TIGR02293 family)